MARHLRLSFEGATYHITARGSRKEKIFYSDKDKGVFLNKMGETFEKLYKNIALGDENFGLY